MSEWVTVFLCAGSTSASVIYECMQMVPMDGCVDEVYWPRLDFLLPRAPSWIHQSRLVGYGRVCALICALCMCASLSGLGSFLFTFCDFQGATFLTKACIFFKLQTLVKITVNHIKTALVGLVCFIHFGRCGKLAFISHRQTFPEVFFPALIMHLTTVKHHKTEKSFATYLCACLF